VFFTVTTLAALVVPIISAVNVSLVGVAVTTTVGALPVPVRFSVCGEFDAVSVIVSVPVRVPTLVGVNVTLAVQLPPPASVLPHVLVSAKSPVVANEIVVDSPPVFFTVTTLAALVVPSVCAANVSVVGVAVTITGAVPVPVSFTVCGEFVALSMTVTVPVSVPAAWGVNVTVTEQLAPALRVAGQLLVCAKSPVDAIVIGVATVPVSFTVTTLPALVVPTICAANVSLAGVAVTMTTAATPVPVSFTVCGEFVAVSVIVSVPVRVPAVVGVNVTLTVQLAGDGPNVPVQVPAVSAKSPVVPKEIDVDPVPVFFTVTTLAALVVPSA
jgi:hypothetical protein